MALVDDYRSWCSSSLGTPLHDCVHRLGAFPADQEGGAGDHCDTEVGPGSGQVPSGRKAYLCGVEAHDFVGRRGADTPAGDEDRAFQRKGTGMGQRSRQMPGDAAMTGRQVDPLDVRDLLPIVFTTKEPDRSVAGHDGRVAYRHGKSSDDRECPAILGPQDVGRPLGAVKTTQDITRVAVADRDKVSTWLGEVADHPG